MDKVNTTTQRRVYNLKDYANEDITGSWYDKELQPKEESLFSREGYSQTEGGARRTGTIC